MKKIISFILAFIFVFGLVSCASNEEDKGEDKQKNSEEECVSCVDSDNDLKCDVCKKPMSKKRLVCGVTYITSMCEKDANGEWTGFEIEFAREVGKLIGMEVEFEMIHWPNKYTSLDSGSIDCIWNAFDAVALENGETKRSELVDFSYGYISNHSVIVVNKNDLAKYTSEESFRGKRACVEKGSVYEDFVRYLTEDVAEVNDYIDALNSLKSGKVDFIMIDSIYANSLCGEGDYADLVIIEDVEFDFDVFEVYAVGFKKGSDLTEKVNAGIKQLFDNGKVYEIAKKWNLENSLRLTEDVTKI